MQDLDERLKRMALILGWMLILAGAGLTLYLAGPLLGGLLGLLSPFLVALVVAYLFHPLVLFVQRRLRLGRMGGMLVVGLVLVTIGLVFIGVLAPLLYGQSARLAGSAAERIEQWVGEMPETDLDGLRGSLREFLDSLRGRLESAQLDYGELAMQAGATVGQGLGAKEGGAAARESAGGGLAQLFSSFLNAIGGVFGFFSSLLLVVIISCYYLLDFDQIPGLLRRALPARYEERTMEVLGKVDRALGGFLRGQLIVCCTVGALATLGLLAIGMREYAVLVGVLAGAANFVPYLGPVIGATPALLWALLDAGHETWPERGLYAALVLGLFAAIQMIDGFILQPRIVGKSSNLHPLIVMLALVAGAPLGLTGMIVAVPLACIGRVLFLELFWIPYQAGKLPVDGRGPEGEGA